MHQIRLEIFSNCTDPEKANMDAIKQSKQVVIMLSLDGYSEAQYTFTLSSKWYKVEETLDKWIETREEFGGPDNDKFIVGAAPQ